MDPWQNRVKMNIFNVFRLEALGEEQRSRTLLMLALCIASLIAALFYLLPQPGHNQNVNLALAAVLLSLVPLVLFTKLYRIVAHVLMAGVIGTLLYIASKTGGVHSSEMVWIVVSFIAALLFLGPQATLAWVVVALAAQIFLWWMAQIGRIDAGIPQHDLLLPLSYLNHMGGVSCLMLGLWFLDQLHARRIQEVKQRNEELLRLHVSLQTAQAHKDEFVAAIGHELRTSMNAILGLNGVLRDEYANEPDVVDTVDHIRHSTQRLLSLVNDILDYSQLQAGKVAFVPEVCHLPTLFEPINVKYAQLAKEDGLEWVVDISPLIVKIDGFRLKQVVDQLLGNAFKFTNAGQVRISAHYQSYFLRIEVHDTGRGIPEHRQQEVFNRFEHADQQTNRAFGGVGLGLAICERLVSLQRGRLGVVSREEQGSMFWLELPCELLDGDAQTPALAKMRQLPSHLRLLVVDDNPVNLMVAKLQIAKAVPGAAVDTARSGKEALELIAAHQYHAALVDMVMPDMDGLTLTSRLRSMSPAIAQMPILAYTANQNPVDIQRCLDAGMNAVLHKPIDEAVLKHTLTQWLTQPETGASA
jgi:signal transduction histidine kinase/ActR/RegA family two-component response regulator